MTTLQFIASLASTLAWPLVVLVIVFLFRDKIAELLSSSVKRLKVGPFEAEWDRAISAAQVELDQPGALPLAQGPVRGSASEELAELASISPQAAVVQGYSRIEQALRDLLSDVEGPAKLRLGGAGLARLAAHHDCITEETARSIEGLTLLRNLAAHGRAADTTRERATDYLALVDAVLFILRPKQDE